jgi:hypothetical protein
MRFGFLSFALTVQYAAAFAPQLPNRGLSAFGVASKSFESLSAVASKKRKDVGNDSAVPSNEKKGFGNDGVASLIMDVAEETSKMEAVNGENDANGEATPHFAKDVAEEKAIVENAIGEEIVTEPDAQHSYDEAQMILAIEVALEA